MVVRRGCGGEERMWVVVVRRGISSNCHFVVMQIFIF